MKANQKFVSADEAVSPVIGVILMVAITVVLAAVVFVLVQGLGSDADSAPTFQLSKDESNDRLEVISAESDADWNRLTIRADKTGTEWALNFATTTAGSNNGTIGTSATEITGSADTMSAGEYMEFCGTSAEVTEITFTIVDSASNQKIGDYKFSSIAACA